MDHARLAAAHEAGVRLLNAGNARQLAAMSQILCQRHRSRFRRGFFGVRARRFDQHRQGDFSARPSLFPPPGGASSSRRWNGRTASRCTPPGARRAALTVHSRSPPVPGSRLTGVKPFGRLSQNGVRCDRLQVQRAVRLRCPKDSVTVVPPPGRDGCGRRGNRADQAGSPRRVRVAASSAISAALKPSSPAMRAIASSL